jgi:predicted MFS family arabinose efflux permease
VTKSAEPNVASAVHVCAESHPSTALLTILTISVGALVANLYYAQPLIAHIAPEIGVSPGIAGSIVSVTQIGYGVGLFFLVPIADWIENRRLVLSMLSLTILGLVTLVTVNSVPVFFLASFMIGVCATGAQSCCRSSRILSLPNGAGGSRAR